MIPDYGRYYGCVFSQIIEGLPEALTVRKLDVGILGFFIIDERLPLYIKFSRNRKGPWTFNFLREHQVQYSALVNQHGNCITALVCGKDGIVALDHAQLREILDENFEEQEAVSVRRKLRHMYSVTGTHGKLTNKVSQDALCTLIGAVTRVQ